MSGNEKEENASKNSRPQENMRFKDIICMGIVKTVDNGECLILTTSMVDRGKTHTGWKISIQSAGGVI